MHAFKFLIFALLAVFGLCSPTPFPHESLEKRQGLLQSYDCEGNRYNALQVATARAQACFLIKTGRRVGTGQGYPKSFKNKEGFNLNNIPPPWYDFPILSSFQPYLGGIPGPDRIIINSQCQVGNLLTHTNAPNPSSFVECKKV